MHHNRPARALFSLPSLAGLALLAFVTLHVTGSARASASASDHPSATGFLILDDGRQTHEALLLDSNLMLDVQGLLGSLTLTQRFSNQSGLWLEGRYSFPMPSDGIVRGLQISLGDRTINGVIKENQEAEHVYRAAAAAGEVASIVRLDRPNLFNVRVANIAPHQEVIVRLDVVLPVQFDEGAFRLSLPTTFTPRYTNAATPDADILNTPVVPASSIRGPRLDLLGTIEGIIDAAFVQSPTHSLKSNGAEFRLEAVPMDRDVELTWTLPMGQDTQTLLYSSKHDGHRYLQLMMVPPTMTHKPGPPSLMSRELVLVVDKSGSMAGQSVRAARAALQSALDGLIGTDRFNIIAFDDRLQALFSESRSASPENLSLGRQYINQLEADGGTEMMPALQMALHGGQSASLEKTGNPTLRQIVFMTDGSVGYENQMLETIDAQLGEARLFTIGIGSAPNQWFLGKAAELGRGSSLNITDITRVEATMTRLFDMLARPALTDIRIQLDSGEMDFHPAQVPDLYSGEPLMLIGRLGDQASQVSVSGLLGGQVFKRTLQIPPAPDATQMRLVDNHETRAGEKTEQLSERSTPALPSSMAQHWARSKIESLEDDQRRSPSAVEHGNDERDIHRDQMTRLALSHNLVTKYTRFVAVEQMRQRPISEPLNRGQVANLMPAGNTMGIIGLPAGAAGADTLGLLALLSALSGGVCLLLRRRCRNSYL